MESYVCKKPMLVRGSYIKFHRIERHEKYLCEVTDFSVIVYTGGHCRLSLNEFKNTFYSHSELRKYKLENVG